MSIYATDAAGKRIKIAGVGLPGPAGKSAYQYAVEGGFTGTEDEFKALMGVRSNPNLLDNWYFADPINQRGQTEYTSNGSIVYTIDRWYINGQVKLTVDNGLKIEATAAGGAWWLRQKTENNLVGGTVTASVLIHSNVSSHLIFNVSGAQTFVPAKTDGYELITTTFEVTQQNIEIGFVTNAGLNIGDFIKIKAIKLELGPVQTLAHKDASGNWVLNDPPPNKTLEVLKCQRCYERNVLDSTALRFTNPTEVYQTPIGFGFFVYFEVEKRVNPTVKLIYTIGDGALQETTINMVQKIGFTNSQIAVPPNQFIAVRGYEASSDF